MTPSAPADDFIGYLRSFTDQGFEGPVPIEELWDRYHTPDSVHTRNQKELDRADSLKKLQKWRLSETSYDLRIHEAVLGSDLAAVRYTITTPLMWELNMETEYNSFNVLAEDGRISSSFTTDRTRYVWGGGEGIWDADAKPGPAPAPVKGDHPTPAEDLAHYLHEFNTIGSDKDEATIAEAFDRFHTADCVHYINNNASNRQEVVSSLKASRKKGLDYKLEISDAIQQGDRFAARYAMVPTRERKGGPDLEVFTFGQFARDGRVQVMRSAIQTSRGTWPF